MTWGIGPWGTEGYGIEPYLSVAGATAYSTHDVLVTLTKPPQDVSLLLDGDVRNPASWVVERLDTGAQLVVAEVTPAAGQTVWNVHVLDALAPSTDMVRVTIVNMRDAGGNIAQAPLSATFLGVTPKTQANAAQIAAARGTSSRDIANVAAPVGGVESGVGGVFRISGGDYALVDGAEFVRKLVIRRLTTTPGDFFHLPNYGCGLQLKQTIPGGIVKFKAQVARELQREPGVVVNKIELTITGNLLTILVNATLSQTGQQVGVAVNTQISSVGF